MNTRKHISLITALAVLVNAAFSIMAGDRLAAQAASGLNVIPICTLYGIQYKDVSGGKHAPASDSKHCVLCYWSSLSAGASSEPVSAVYDTPVIISGTTITPSGEVNPKLHASSNNCSRAPPSYL